MFEQPLVSIGIPTYNRPAGLEKLLKYLLLQDYPNLEILVSDNCSTDPKVEEILKKYSLIDSRISYFIQNENIEIEPNFNFVYSKGHGKYFMWIADDDNYSTNYIQECVNFLEQNPGYILCSGVASYYKGKSLIFREKSISLEHSSALIRLLKYFILVNKNGVFYGVFRNQEKFNAPIQKHVGADWCHVARIALLGRIKTIGLCECQRSDEGGSTSRAKIVKRWNARGIRKVFFETYTANQISKYLFNENTLKQKYNSTYRLAIQIIVFVMLNCKFLANSIFRRIKILKPISMGINKYWI